jgi:DNA-binding XRE family transcriptional regulator
MPLKLSTKKAIRELRIKIAVHGILSIADLAEKIGCSRTSIYLALENPERYPIVSQKIQELAK